MFDIEKYNNLSQEELNATLTAACSYNHVNVDFVQFLTTSPDLIKHAEISYNYFKAFTNACYYGNLEIIDFFLTSPLLTEKINIHHGDEYAFNIACENGFLEIVQFLLSSPKLIENANPYVKNHHGLRHACSNNRKEVVEYLCNLPSHIYVPDLLAGGQQGFSDACQSGNTELFDYLLSLPKEFGIIQPAANNNKAWCEAVYYSRHDILDRLYGFDDVKNSLNNFSQTGFHNLIENPYNKDSDMQHLLSYPEIEKHLHDKQSFNQLLSFIFKHNNITFFSYLISEYSDMIHQNFMHENRKKIPKEIKHYYSKYQLMKSLDGDLEIKSAGVKRKI